MSSCHHLSSFGIPPLPLERWCHLWTAPYDHTNDDDDDNDHDDDVDDDGGDDDGDGDNGTWVEMPSMLVTRRGESSSFSKKLFLSWSITVINYCEKEIIMLITMIIG